MLYELSPCKNSAFKEKAINFAEFYDQSPMLPVEYAIQQICAQHRSMLMVLGMLNSDIGGIVAGSFPAEFGRLRAIVGYLESFGERVHGGIEDTHLVGALRKRHAPPDLTDQSLNEHGVGAAVLESLQANLNDWNRANYTGDSALPELASNFYKLQRGHFAFEERVLLPCAVELLPADDWSALGRALESHPDPVFGSNLHPEYSSLAYLRQLAPASESTGVSGNLQSSIR
ncbi:MAG: hemerythrin domain-containing protein [Usitatibacteraceae bacterium]